MYLGVSIPTDFNKLWYEGMKDEEGNLPSRAKEDSIEKSFWKDFIGRRKNYEEDKFIFPLKEEILKLINKEDSVLEIGPGWGNYTFDIARRVEEISCIDISKDILEYIKKGCIEKELPQIKGIEGKFEDYNFQEKYDVVFGVNCYYRMRDIKEVIKKINNLSKRISIIGFTSGPDKPHYLELNNKFRYKINSPRRDYIHIYNLLYSLNIYGNIKIVDLKKDYVYDSYDEALKDNTSKILSKYDVEEVKEVLDKYLVYENDKVIYTHNFKGVLIYWNAKKEL
ncbi:class I SAM-dependent methyltransferase [Clostridium sp. MSJ-11]|uniref:Class I SAM-dependent methyltransferase n=1 Tax=Clostridium mobile TaxID=2841512 RepID=A0ABS6EFE2_9CLOT|nr:class I SAM-dependent methyltransferase [Clostridium mobile]MBU5483932.1 class I SAM-dependent methyltransferase [Clostridium mobile]